MMYYKLISIFYCKILKNILKYNEWYSIMFHFNNMGTDTVIYRSIDGYAEDDLTEEIIGSLDDWISEYSSLNFFGWDVEYKHECVIMTLDNKTRGDIESYIKPLLLFLNECAKYSILVNDSVSYFMTWGDSESGAIYISSSEKIIKISGITNFGQTTDYHIEWN